MVVWLFDFDVCELVDCGIVLIVVVYDMNYLCFFEDVYCDWK